MKKNFFSQAKYWSKVAVIGVVLGFALQFARAWTEPSAAPPGGNLGAPINTGSITQTKSGDICTNYGGTTKCLSSSSGGGGAIILAAEDYAGQTGHAACASVGKTCDHVISYNYVYADNGGYATNNVHVCAVVYNLVQPGIVTGYHDNIHFCETQLGNIATFWVHGWLECHAYTSAVCK